MHSRKASRQGLLQRVNSSSINDNNHALSKLPLGSPILTAGAGAAFTPLGSQPAEASPVPAAELLPNIPEDIPLQCSACLETIRESALVSLHNKHFHKSCLVCSECQLEFSKQTEMSTGAKFYLISGRIYCNLHAKGRLKICNTCKELIQDKKAVSIPRTGVYYHASCLECSNPKCKKSLQSQDKIVLKDGKVFCKQHATSGEAASTCGVCRKSIDIAQDRSIDGKLIRSPLSGVIYHSACLKCSFCKVKLSAESTFRPKYRNGRFFCPADYEWLTPKCTACGLEIMTKSISVKSGEVYHEACFKCSICGFHLDKFGSFCGELRCAEHKKDFPLTNMKCRICALPVRASSVKRFAGILMHDKCFTCADCRKPIKVHKGQTKAILGSSDEEIHCWDCLRKAVGSKPGKNEDDAVVLMPNIEEEEEKESSTRSKSKGTLRKLRNFLSSELSQEEMEVRRSREDATATIRPEPELFDLNLIESITVDGKENEEEYKHDEIGFNEESDELDHFFQKHQTTMMYDKGEKIGEGSFGKVYVCRRRPDNLLMAMKQMDLVEEFSSTSDPRKHPKVREMIKEAQILCKLKHPNVVKFLGTQIDVNKKSLNIFMEYIPGRSLFGHLYEFGAYSEQALRYTLRQILSGLKYLHEQGIIHRDLKSKNILVSNRGVPKLADFGSAKMIDLSGNQQINSVLEASVHVSTPLYFPPEFVLHNVYTEKSDIWSFGCVAIEMASAKLPWSEMRFENEWAAARHIAQDGSVPQITVAVSEPLKDFIYSCLNRDPKKRPSAAQLLEHPFLAIQ